MHQRITTDDPDHQPTTDASPDPDQPRYGGHRDATCPVKQLAQQPYLAGIPGYQGRPCTLPGCDCNDEPPLNLG